MTTGSLLLFGVSSINKLHQPDGLLFGTDLNTGLLSFPVSKLRTKSSLALLVVITTVANPCWLIWGGLLGLTVTITDLHAYIRGPLIHPSASAAWLARQLQRYIIVIIFTLKTHSWTKSLLQALLTSRNLKLPLWWGGLWGLFLAAPAQIPPADVHQIRGYWGIDVGLGGSFSGASMPGWSSRSAKESLGFGILFIVSGSLIQWAGGVEAGNHRRIFLNAPLPSCLQEPLILFWGPCMLWGSSHMGRNPVIHEAFGGFCTFFLSGKKTCRGGALGKYFHFKITFLKLFPILT